MYIPGYVKGVNLGGWLSQTHDMSREHYAGYITEDDIKKIASFGLDHVRVPVDYMLIENEDGSVLEEGYGYIDNCITWCRRHGLHMVIDLHKTYGYTFDPTDKGDKTAFFKDPSMQVRYFDLWRRFAKRYAGDSDVVAFELLNEIVLPEVKDLWNDIALKTIKLIREYAPDNWIMFGGVYYNSVVSVQWLPVVEDRKAAYVFHCYEPFLFTHQGAHWVDGMPDDFRTGYPRTLEEYRDQGRQLTADLVKDLYYDCIDRIGPEYFEGLFASALKVSEERGIPLYCSEYGAIDNAGREDVVRWLGDIHTVLEKHNIGRALWNYKELYFGLTSEAIKPYISEVLKRL